MLTAIIPVAVAYEMTHKEDYKPIVVKRMTNLVPLSSNVVLAGDERSMSALHPAANSLHCPSHHVVKEQSITGRNEFVREPEITHGQIEHKTASH